jgi:hypothetical protein
VTPKLVEIRDAGTFVPALAVKLDPSCEQERYLLARTGFGRSPVDQGMYVMLMRLAGGSGDAKCDPYEWGNRAMQVAHEHLVEHFDEIVSGSVVDVEYIMGVTSAPKRSEAEEHP